MKKFIKQAILASWYENGLTLQDAEYIADNFDSLLVKCSDDRLIKQADPEGNIESAINLGYVKLPTLLGVGSVIGGALYYLATHPNETIEKLRKSRIDTFNKMINMYRDYTPDYNKKNIDEEAETKRKKLELERQHSKDLMLHQSKNLL